MAPHFVQYLVIFFRSPNQDLGVRKNAKASNHEPKDQVAHPAGEANTQENVAEEFGLFRCIQCSWNVTGSYLSVYLSGEDDADYSERETADS
jgi:hypothetical protein